MQALNLAKFKEYGLDIRPYLMAGKRIQIQDRIWKIVAKDGQTLKLAELNVEREAINEDQIEIQDLYKLLG